MKKLLLVLFSLFWFSTLASAAVVSSAPVTIVPIVIVTGNAFQQILAASTINNRFSLTIQNNNATDSCWVFLGPNASATKATSILLLAGGSYTRYYPYIPSNAIQVTCASTADTMYLDTQ